MPGSLEFPGRCAGVEIERRPGLVIRDGFFFDLDSHQWESIQVC